MIIEERNNARDILRTTTWCGEKENILVLS
jgi:hypothetical protein